jgi:hypothetical protein
MNIVSILNYLLIQIVNFFIHLYSECEYIYKQNVHPIVKELLRKENSYDYIYEGKIIHTSTKNNINMNSFDNKFDFIIYNFEKDDKKYARIIESEHELYDDLVITSVYFLVVELVYNNTKYSINLSDPINYYIEKNVILDYSFLKYYMNVNYNISITNDYKLNIIDKKMNTHELTYVSSIEFKEGKYTVINSNYDSDDNE